MLMKPEALSASCSVWNQTGEGYMTYKLWYAWVWPDTVFYINRAQNANFQNSRCENTPLIGRESPPPSVSLSYISNSFVCVIEPELHSGFMFLAEALLSPHSESMCISAKLVSVLEYNHKQPSNSKTWRAPGRWAVSTFSCCSSLLAAKCCFPGFWLVESSEMEKLMNTSSAGTCRTECVEVALVSSSLAHAFRLSLTSSHTSQTHLLCVCDDAFGCLC